MLEHAKEITLVLGLLNLAFLGGWQLSKIAAHTAAAHHRIDTLEDRLTKSLTDAIHEAWRFCPLASKDAHGGD